MSPGFTFTTAALAAAERAGDDTAQAAAHLGISGAWTRQDRFVEAIRHGRRALELAERAGRIDCYLVLEGQGLVAAADAALLLGRPDVAHEHARAALDVHQRSGYVPGRAAADRVLNATLGALVARRGGDRVVPAPSWRLIRPA